eukprot:136907-Rhodomonas_salina.1
MGEREREREKRQRSQSEGENSELEREREGEGREGTHDAVLHTLLLLVHAEDGPGRDVCVHVRGAIQGVKHSHILGPDVSKHVLVLALAARHPAAVEKEGQVEDRRKRPRENDDECLRE